MARKLVAMYKVNSRVETLMSDGLTDTVDELFDYRAATGNNPHPDWYFDQLNHLGSTTTHTPHVDLDLSDLDASDSDVDLPAVDLPPRGRVWGGSADPVRLARTGAVGGSGRRAG